MMQVCGGFMQVVLIQPAYIYKKSMIIMSITAGLKQLFLLLVLKSLLCDKYVPINYELTLKWDACIHRMSKNEEERLNLFSASNLKC